MGGKKVLVSEGQKIDNWKKVQQVFRKKQISKPLDVKRYVNGKFQDNLEALQWFKHFFEFTYKGNPYAAYKKRWKKDGPTGPIVLYWDETTRSLQDESAVSADSSYSGSTEVKKTSKKKAGGAKKKKKKGGGGGGGDLGKANNKLALTVEAVEKERNFYFAKLREIEILCQGDNNDMDKIEDASSLKAAVLKIMYKTDDDGDMVAPDGNEGEDNDGEDEENVTF